MSAVTDTPDIVQLDGVARDQAREDRGRLVAVAGLCGGAGASTLAYLTCCAAVADGQEPVVCIDATGRAGIATYARTHGALSFAHAAIELQAGRMPESKRLFATSDDGVRVLCSTPSLDQPLVAVDGAARLLADARAAHALTVVDCGTLTSEYERLALRSSGHVVLVTPATQSGIERAAPLAAQARELCPPGGSAALVARLDQGERKAPVSDLTPIAEAIAASLVLCPHIPDLRNQPVDRALENAQITLQALQGAPTR